LLDNFWQVLKNTDNPNQHVIAIRGTVNTTPSILADLLLPLVKARIGIKGFPLSINLARDEGDSKVVAGVHAGFLLGLLLMLVTTDRPLAATLTELALNPDAEIYITGHSQGASLALLLTSLVNHTGAFKSTYKTYAFAPAKPGNDHYAYDLDQVASVMGFCYSVVNSQGWVPQVPLTLQTFGTVNTPNPVYEFSGQVNPAIPAELKKLLEEFDEGFKAVWNDIKNLLEKIIGDLKADVPKATFALTASGVGAQGDATFEASTFTSLLDDLLSMLLPSLNYAKAGALVPVFAQPGGNPADKKYNQFDFFWQHHLCNYLHYLTQQYGPEAGGCLRALI
ncbi:MAG TPA: hypothetical protein VLU25_09375, partial [Acidobacteriota bacterium]|nr:hypothetical protein [Acidobacteriota bacterium]